MYGLIFPTRSGLTCGSNEFEEVIKCFEIENEVVFARRDSETKESTEVQNGCEDESLNVRKRCSTTVEDLNMKFKDFSLEKNLAGKNRGKTKPVNTNQMQRWNSSPNISNERTKFLWVKGWQPKPKGVSSRKFTVNHEEQTTRRRSSLPSYVLSNQWNAAISPRNQTAKVNKLEFRADEDSHNKNKLLPVGCINDPDFKLYDCSLLYCFLQR